MPAQAIDNLHRVPPTAWVVLRLYTHCPVCQRYWDAVVWEGPVADLRGGRGIRMQIPEFRCCRQVFRPPYFKALWMGRLIAVGPLGALPVTRWG